jgi:hypothetical protein
MHKVETMLGKEEEEEEEEGGAIIAIKNSSLETVPLDHAL